MSIERISSNEWIVSGAFIEDRKFIITKTTKSYRVERFRKREEGYFGRLLCERGGLRYFKTREHAEAFIMRQDFSK